MPPKGWKKTQEPSLLHQEADLVSIDDILFPRATISKSIRAILDADDNDKMTLSKDSLIAIQRAATVFVSHLLFHARQFAKHSNRKNVYASDILAGLEYAGFAGFTPRVKQLLATYEEDVSITRRRKAAERASGQRLVVKDEPSTKKPKVEGGAAGTLNTNDDAEDGSDIEDDVVEVEAEAEEDDDDFVVEDDGDEEDATKNNPIALLNKEQEELEGAEVEEPKLKDEDEEDSENENGNENEDENNDEDST